MTFCVALRHSGNVCFVRKLIPSVAPPKGRDFIMCNRFSSSQFGSSAPSLVMFWYVFVAGTDINCRISMMQSFMSEHDFARA